MIKLICTDDHQELRAADNSYGPEVWDFATDKITKSASDAITRDMISEHRPPDNMVGVHAITMGAEEDYGPNRNADSASREALRKYHPTFMKYGCIYREHRNTDPEKFGIGVVKIAAYNEREHRGELFFWVDKDKAPDIYKSAKENKELSWSMSMRLPFDRCSVCDNKARSRRQYCADLTQHKLRMVPGHNKIAYARNEDDVKFYDLSEVKKRADRLATYLSYTFGDEHQKAASEFDDVVGGADWADFYGHSEDLITLFSTAERSMLAKTAAALQEGHAFRDNLKVLAPRDLSPNIIRELANHSFPAVAGEMTKRAMLLPFNSFAALVLGVTPDTAALDPNLIKAASHIPDIFTEMEKLGGCACGENPESVCGPSAYGATYEGGKDIIDQMLAKAEADAGMSADSCTQRMLVIQIKVANEAAPTSNIDADLADGLAKLYAFYAVKSASAIAQRGLVNEDLVAQFLSILVDQE